MLLDPSKPAGALMANGNHMPGTWAADYFNKGQFGKGSLWTGLVDFYGDVYVTGTKTAAGKRLAVNSLGVVDADPGPTYMSIVSIGSREFLHLDGLRIFGNVDSDSTELGANRPGLFLTNCALWSANGPDLNAATFEDDTAWNTAAGLRGIRVVLALPVTLPSATIRVTNPSNNQLSTAPQPGTLRVGNKYTVPQNVNYTTVTDNGDGTTTFGGCSGGTGTYPAGAKVGIGLDRVSGRFLPINCILGPSTDLLVMWGGDDDAGNSAVEIKNCEPETAGDIALDRFVVYGFSGDGIHYTRRAGAGTEPSKNLRIRHGSMSQHPGVFAVTGVHGDGLRLKTCDNSALNGADSPAFEWVAMLNLRGNAGIYASAEGPVLNVGVKHCLFSCENKAMQYGDPTLSGAYAGYSWVDKSNKSSSVIGSSPGVSMVEIRADNDPGNLVPPSVAGLDDSIPPAPTSDVFTTQPRRRG